MRKSASAMALAISVAAYASPTHMTLDDPLDLTVRALNSEITTHTNVYDNLAELTALGHRLPGSLGAEQAIQWAAAKLTSYGFENITLQPMTTPLWTRGSIEKATIVEGRDHQDLRIATLGGSVGTGSRYIEAEVIEVHSPAEVEQLGERVVRDKIVFYNRPMNPNIDPFDAYDEAYDQRSRGAIKAAQFGAVATLVRSLTPQVDDEYPHTGLVSYANGVTKIPAAAISTRDAARLSSRLQMNPHLRVKMALSAQSHGFGTSYNVYADILGNEHPDEIVLVGAHLDSWDLGVGAHDDGAGVVQSIEVLRAIKALGLSPKRTIRVVLFMSEELGGHGAYEYAADARRQKMHHIAAIESDRGGFAPVGFATDAGPAAERKLRDWSSYLSSLRADVVFSGSSGVDVAPLRDLGAITIGLVPESGRYFDYHHAATDQFSAIVKEDLQAGAAAMAALAWLFAEEGAQAASGALFRRERTATR